MGVESSRHITLICLFLTLYDKRGPSRSYVPWNTTTLRNQFGVEYTTQEQDARRYCANSEPKLTIVKLSQDRKSYEGLAKSLKVGYKLSKVVHNCKKRLVNIYMGLNSYLRYQYMHMHTVSLPTVSTPLSETYFCENSKCRRQNRGYSGINVIASVT